MAPKATVAKTTDSKSSVTPTNVAKAAIQTQSPVTTQAQILQLHRQYGNQGVQRMYESGQLQAKLKLGKPNDRYEREADSVADRVMSMPEPLVVRQEEATEEVQTKPIAETITPLVQRQAEPEEEIQEKEEEKEEVAQAKLIQRAEEEEEPQAKLIQREEEKEEVQGWFVQKEEDEDAQKAPEEEESQTAPLIQTKGGDSPNLSSSTESSIRNMKGGGQPLPESTRSFMEPRFGADFSAVRVHNDSRAHSLSRSVNARAFTLGSDVVFGQGQYAPDTSDGKQLMAHELTHVVQQGGAVRKKSLPISHTKPSIQRWSIKGIIESILDFIPGYSLLCVFLGENPVTGSKVAQNGENLIKGVMGLIPAIGMIIFKQLKETGSTERAGQWVDKQMKKVGISIPMIKKLIDIAWDRISIWKGISGNIEVIKEVFSPVLGKIKFILGAVKQKVKELILEGFLMMAGSMGKKVWGVLRRDPKALKRIINNPGIIFKNFFKGVKMGFDNFGKNFIKHFKNSVMEWVFGTMGKAGLQMPEKFNIAGIFSIVMQVLNLTYQGIRAQVVKGLASKFGPDKAEKAVSMVEKSVEFVQKLITKGPIALWEMVKKQLGNLKDKVLGGIVTWARNTIIKKAIAKIVSMLNPAGAIIQVCLTIYNVVMFFINNWNRIKAIVSSIFNAVAIAALGQTKKIGMYIEGVLAKGMTLLIAFLARLIGLGGIAKEVKRIIAKIRKPINMALQKVVAFIIKLASPLIKVVGKAGKKASQAIEKAKQKGKAAVSAVKVKGKAAIGKGVKVPLDKMSPSDKKNSAKKDFMVEVRSKKGLTKQKIDKLLAELKLKHKLTDARMVGKGKDAKVQLKASPPTDILLELPEVPEMSGQKEGAEGNQAIKNKDYIKAKQYDGPFPTPGKEIQDHFNKAFTGKSIPGGGAVVPPLNLGNIPLKANSGGSYLRARKVEAQSSVTRGTGRSGSGETIFGHFGADEERIKTGDNSTSYNGGHLVGDQMMDSKKSFKLYEDWNLAPQTRAMNSPTYSGAIEGPVTKAINAGATIKYDVNVRYPDMSYLIKPSQLVKNLWGKNNNYRKNIESVIAAESSLDAPLTLTRRTPEHWQATAKVVDGTATISGGAKTRGNVGYGAGADKEVTFFLEVDKGKGKGKEAVAAPEESGKKAEYEGAKEVTFTGAQKTF